MINDPCNYVHGLWDEGLAWLIGRSMPGGCIMWAQQSISTGYGQPLVAPRYYSQCPSAATSKVAKAPLSRIVSGTISSELPLPFYL